MRKYLRKEAQTDAGKEFLLEGCVDSVESAVIATRAGAGRLELCQSLVVGGTTPTAALYEEVRESCENRIHVLIRPRFGDFCYTKQEFAVIRREVRVFSRLGADGIVIGILRPDGSLDRERMRILMEEAEGMKVTLHRAFDMCADPFAALEEATELGIHTILTSGRKNTCLDGAECLKQLEARSAGRVEIMAGGGVSAAVIETLYQDTGICAYHMSGKRILESSMTYRGSQVLMGLCGLSEYEIYQADEGKIRAAAELLSRLKAEKGENIKKY